MSWLKIFISFALLFSSVAVIAQKNINAPVSDTSFPESWDRKQKLRGSVYDVLAWVHKKDISGNEIRSCLTVFESTDSPGKPQYFLSQHYTDKKPFTKWNYDFIYYGRSAFTDSGIIVGYFDLHLEIFDHKPSEKELYELIRKWEFEFYNEDWITLEAGLDSKLWQTVFGFKPDLKFTLEH